MEAYLDNAATTKATPEAVKKMVEALSQNYGNPSSKHIKGFEAERYIREARDVIASTLKVQPKEIIFTSGGTESNNLALIGAALANMRAGKHIIASAFEHPSVYNAMLFLKEMGYEIDFAPVDALGHIRLEELTGLVRDDTIIVSVMYVNNEIGAVQDISSIADSVRKKKKNVLMHVDAIQAYGRFPIYPEKEGIDMMSVSAHKLHGPKGAGFLYCSSKVKLKPLMYGGGQQNGYRSGTENVPAIGGMSEAVLRMFSDNRQKRDYMYGLKQLFIEKISGLEGIRINGIPEARTGDWLYQAAPHIVSVSFDGIDKSEVLLHALEEKGVYASSGSACSSNHPGISGTLKAIGLSNKIASSTLRFSFCDTTTAEEVEYAVECLRELLPVLRRFKRR